MYGFPGVYTNFVGVCLPNHSFQCAWLYIKYKNLFHDFQYL